MVAIILSVVAMLRRSEPVEEEAFRDGQLTLEESIERATLMRQKAEAEDEYEDYYYDEDYYEEEHPEEVADEREEDVKTEDEVTGRIEEDDAPGYEDLKKDKPLQYERLKDRYSSHEDHATEDEEPLPKGVPLRVEEPVKTTPADYEKEMDRPVWRDEPEEKKPGFRNWDLVMILFLSGISLLFLYFNPLKTTTTSVIFFVLILFILGYAGLTIIFPDKSRVRSRTLILTTVIIAIFLFTLSFLAWWTHLLPSVPKYMVQIMFVASILLSVGAFIRKWRATPRDKPEKDDDEEIPEDEIIPDHVKKARVEEITPEVTPTEEVVTTEEEIPVRPVKKIPVSEETEIQDETKKKDPFSFLRSRGKDEKTEIVAEKEIKKTPPGFKPRNYYLDIILMATITLLTVAFVIIPPLNKTFIRTILGILLVLFIPGYTLIAALFPKWVDLDGIERAALSFGLSIAVTPLIGLALNYTPWGIRLDPILISLTIFTLAMCTIAFLRRRKLPDEEKYFVPFGGFFKDIRKSFQAESGTERILSIILVISIILAISTTAYIIVKPKEGEKFTEFYILGPDGKASNYPTNLTTGQNGSVIIGVVNHEYTTTDYLLMVKVNNSTLKNETLTLTSGQKMEIPFNFTAGSTGQKKMEFLLYKLPNNETSYRNLHLWLNVK